MLRFLVGLIIVLGLFCLVWTFLGEDAFIWALLLGIAGGGFGLIFLPLTKWGPEYAYQKRYLRLALLAILVVVAILAAFIFILFRLNVSSDVAGAASGALGVTMAIFAYAWGWSIGPPTRRRGWLRRRYPAVAKAIQRYQQPADQLEDYTPALVVDGKRYFLIYYHDKKNLPRQSGTLLFDEMGNRISDKDLVRRAAECKTLALQTIDYNLHQQRAAGIASVASGVGKAKKMFEVLRAGRERFVQMGPEVAADWERVIAVEDIVLAVLEAGWAIKMLEADWAERHGLGKLMEVAYEDVLELEEQMREARRKVVEALPRLAPATEAARRLAKALHERDRSKASRLLEDGLLGIVELGVLKGEEAFEYAVLSEEQWQAWRERMAWADEVDARLAEAPA